MNMTCNIQLMCVVLVLAASPIAQAANADADVVTERQFQEGQAFVLANAKPLNRSMTLSDSNGCAWEVVEYQGVLKLVRYQKPDGTPVCAAKQQAE